MKKIVNVYSNLFLLRYLRQLVINEACELRYNDCLQRATELYSNIMAADNFRESIKVLYLILIEITICNTQSSSVGVPKEIIAATKSKSLQH